MEKFILKRPRSAPPFPEEERPSGASLKTQRVNDAFADAERAGQFAAQTHRGRRSTRYAGVAVGTACEPSPTPSTLRATPVNARSANFRPRLSPSFRRRPSASRIAMTKLQEGRDVGCTRLLAKTAHDCGTSTHKPEPAQMRDTICNHNAPCTCKHHNRAAAQRVLVKPYRDRYDEVAKRSQSLRTLVCS